MINKVTFDCLLIVKGFLIKGAVGLPTKPLKHEKGGTLKLVPPFLNQNGAAINRPNL